MRIAARIGLPVAAVPIYADSRNGLLLALVEAGWLGWLQAALMPASG